MESSRASKRKRKNRNEHDLGVEEGERAATKAVKSTLDVSLKDHVDNNNEKEKKPPVVIFAHGAGALSSSDWMIRWRDMLAKALSAVEVVTFDYPYISAEKRRAPPKAEKLVEFHSDIVKKTVAKYPEHPLVLAGKSMGSRVSCMVASCKDIEASVVVCLGYPLKGMNGTVRDETLLELTVPVMFVQGSKDGLGPLDTLEQVRLKMKTINELHVIEGGDHSFKIANKFLQSKATSQEAAEADAVQAIAAFVSRSTLK